MQKRIDSASIDAEKRELEYQVARVEEVIELPVEDTALSKVGLQALHHAVAYLGGILAKGMDRVDEFNEENGALFGRMTILYPSSEFRKEGNDWARQRIYTMEPHEDRFSAISKLLDEEHEGLENGSDGMCTCHTTDRDDPTPRRETLSLASGLTDEDTDSQLSRVRERYLLLSDEDYASFTGCSTPCQAERTSGEKSIPR